MTKLDHLLHLVESLESRSDTLVSALDESTALMDKICRNNGHISTFDLTIESVNTAVKSNYDYHVRLVELSGKTDLFESNVAHNDLITNNHTLNNLEDENRFLRDKYRLGYVAESVSRKPSRDLAVEKTVYKTESISNMALKPLRCQNTQVSKKKSRYRISKIFNINPVSYDDTSEASPSMNTSFDHTLDGETVETTVPEHNASDSTVFDHSDDKLSLLNPIEFSVDDNESILSDISITPPKYNSIDNFENFLRKSRINLNSSSYPFVLKQSVSEESLVPQKISIPPITNHKFHNPIDNIKQTPSESLATTIEAIYSGSSYTAVNSKKLLSEVMNNTPKAPFSLFNFALLSPEKTKATAERPAPPRRKSFSGKSLTESFLKLVNSELPTPPTPPDKPHGLKRRKSDKLEQLKSVPKTKPISIRSDSYSKRVPASQGTHSSLTVNTNKSFILSHGHESIFNKPMVSSFSNRSLQEALSTSISF